MPTKHLLVKGKVQGVFYRATAMEMAEKIGVTGWIKNTDEGYVEALVSGDENQLQEFIAWCWQGPQNANVVDVEVRAFPAQSFTGFSIKRDEL